MNLRKMMYVSLFAALVAVFGYIPGIPLPFIPVPITMQTLGVMLAGSVLGRLGGLSMTILVLLAAAGAPVLSGGSGGIGHLLGPTGGYVLSWPIAAFVIGYLREKTNELKVWKLVIFNLLGGIIIVYGVGIPYLSYVTDISINKVAIGNLWFVPGDLVKVVLASIIAIRLHKAYPIYFDNNEDIVSIETEDKFQS